MDLYVGKGTQFGEIKAKDIQDILVKRIAFLSGGRDKTKKQIITISNVKEPFSNTRHEMTTTLNYLSQVSQKPKIFTILIDVRSTSLSAAKPVIRILQSCLRDQIAQILIVKPDEFWEKQKASFNFAKYRNKVGYKTILVSVGKLSLHIDPSQLTQEFGGKFYYNHRNWIENRISFEEYVDEAKRKIDGLQKKTRRDEYRDVDVTSDWSDSGNVTGHASLSSYSDAKERNGHYRVCSDTSGSTLPSRDCKRENSYLIPDGDRNQSGYGDNRDSYSDRYVRGPAPHHHLYSVPADYKKDPNKDSVPGGRLKRSKSDYSVESVKVQRSSDQRSERRGPRSLRHRHDAADSKKLQKAKSEKSIFTSSSNFDEEFSSKVYGSSSTDLVRDRVSSHSRGSSLANDFEDLDDRSDYSFVRLQRSKSDHSVNLNAYTPQPHSSQARPRPLRRRNRDNSRNGRRVEVERSKSVPNLSKNDCKEGKDATLVKGEKLLRKLQTLMDENGFTISSKQNLSKETMSMIQNVSNFQTAIQKMESTTKAEAKEKRKLNRRTIIGIPEVDRIKTSSADSQHLHSLTPTMMRDKLKIIYDWLRGPAEIYLSTFTAFAKTWTEVEKRWNNHTAFMSSNSERIDLLTKTKKAFESLSSAQFKNRNNSSPDPVPQWIISLKKNFRVVFDLNTSFQERLRQRSKVLESSYKFFKTAKKLSSTLGSITRTCKSEATLLDDLDAIQGQIDQLHDSVQTVNDLKDVITDRARHHARVVQQSSTEEEEAHSIRTHIERVREIETQLGIGIKRCLELADSSKVRLNHVYQLKAAKEDVQKAIEWLCDTENALRQNQSDFGQSTRDVENLLEQHEKAKTTGKYYYDVGNKQLSAMSVLRRYLDLSPPQGGAQPSLKRYNSSAQLVSKLGKLLPSLEGAWESFDQAWEEKRSKLKIMRKFYNCAEQLYKRGSRLEEDLENLEMTSPSRDQMMTPLQEAHSIFRNDWDHVMKLGNEILVSASDRPSTNSLNQPIRHRMEQLEELKSSLHSKWNRINNPDQGRRFETPRTPRRLNWIETVSELTDWVRMQLVDNSPSVFEIGRNLPQSLRFQKKFEKLLSEVKEKDALVYSVVGQEQQANLYSINTAQSSSSSSFRGFEPRCERKVQKAINHSLVDLWNELNSLLARRHVILQNSVSFYKTAEKFGNQLTCMEQYLQWEELPLDEWTARSLLQILSEMYEQLVDASQSCLEQGQNIVKILKQFRLDNPDNYKVTGQHTSYGSACIAIECTLESLMERRRLLEYRRDARNKLLEHALKMRVWERKVDKVAGWFESVQAAHLEQGHLGVDGSNTKALLCHLDQIKEQAQERLERAKKLIALANEELKAFGDDSVNLQSRDLDALAENFMKRIDVRKNELGATLEYYRRAKECGISLDALEKKLKSERFSTDEEEAQEQEKNVTECVEAVTKPVLTRASYLIQTRKNRNEEAEGVLQSRDKIMERQRHLLEMIEKHSNDASRLRETLQLFMTSCDDMKKKMKDAEEEAFDSRDALVRDVDNASKFLERQKALLSVLDRESSKMKTLLKTANLLLDTGVKSSSEVKDRAESLKSRWQALNKKLRRFHSISEDCTKFLASEKKLLKQINDAHSLVLDHSKQSPDHIEPSLAVRLEESANQIDVESLKIMEESNRLTRRLREIDEDHVDTSAADVTKKVVELHRRKGRLKDAWLSWRYKSGVNQETTVQLGAIEKSIDSLLHSIDEAELVIFRNGEVLLGKDKESNRNLMETVQDRQTSLELLRSDIADVVKRSEMLGMRFPISNPDRNESEEQSQERILRGAVKGLLSRHQSAQEQLKDCHRALSMAGECFLVMEEMKKSMSESEVGLKDALRSCSSNQDEFFFDVKLGSYDVIKNQLDNLMEEVEERSEGVKDFFANSTLNKIDECAFDFEYAIDEMRAEHDEWNKRRKNEKDLLLNQRELIGFNQELEKHRSSLLTKERNLNNLSEQVTRCNNLSDVIAVRKKIALFISETKELEAAWYSSLNTLPSRGEDRQVDVEGTNRELAGVLKRAGKLDTSAQSLEKVFKLSQECDKWNEDIHQLASNIRTKSAKIRSLREADELAELFDNNLRRRVEEQVERSKRVDSVVTEEESNATGSEETASGPEVPEREGKLRVVLRSKQKDIKESLKKLRAEIDDLSDLIENARENFLSNQLFRAKPYYDLSVLYDENLEKEKKTKIRGLKTPDTSPRKRKDVDSPSNSDITSSSSTISNLYDLSEFSSVTPTEESVEEDEHQRSGKVHQGAKSNDNLGFSSAVNRALNSSGSDSNGFVRSPAPRIRRIRKSKDKSPNSYFGAFGDHAQAQQPMRSNRNLATSDKQNDAEPKHQAFKKGFDQTASSMGFQPSSVKTLLSASDSFNSLSSAHSDDTDVLLRSNALPGFNTPQHKDDGRLLFNSTTKSSRRKHGDKKNPNPSSSALTQTTKTHERSRNSKPESSIENFRLVLCQKADADSPKYSRSRSSSFLSSSSSVWDTDCLVAADPRSTKIPSVLARSARNQWNSESGETDDLLTYDPYFGFLSSSSDDTMTLSNFDREKARNDLSKAKEKSSGSTPILNPKSQTIQNPKQADVDKERQNMVIEYLTCLITPKANLEHEKLVKGHEKTKEIENSAGTGHWFDSADDLTDANTSIETVVDAKTVTPLPSIQTEKNPSEISSSSSDEKQ